MPKHTTNPHQGKKIHHSLKIVKKKKLEQKTTQPSRNVVEARANDRILK